MSLIYDVINDAIKMKASDIHLTNSIYPMLRVYGKLVALKSYGVMTPERLADQVKLLLDEHLCQKYKKNRYIDSSAELNGYRFRIHIYRQQNADAFALRLIPLEIPEFNSLHLPEVVRKFTLVKNGLVLITGTTGSGKSTTLASIINEINETQSQHIITVEDPIEFLHQHKESVINQREVGNDVLTFADAVKSAMREDPDILLVGEMRDLDTITNAITMAETGHLVFATLHTKSVAETVDRIIDVFPPEQQKQIRIQLANTLQGIVSQSLLPNKDNKRVPACEVLVVNEAVRSIIKEGGSANSINDQIQMNHKRLGCQSMVQSIAWLYNQGLITQEVAFEQAEDKEMLKRMIIAGS